MRALASLAILALLVVSASARRGPGGPDVALAKGQVPGSLTARFHHVHYWVADPSQAMSEVIARGGGTREIVSGLGVGVRRGDDFLLFDRGDLVTDRQQPPLVSTYERVVQWLRTKGVTVEAGGQARVSDAPGEGYHHIGFAVQDFDTAMQRIGTPLVRRPDSAIYDAGDQVLVEIVRETNLPDAFWCPMHPDVRAGVAGKCPQCGMDLVPIPPPKVGEYRMDVVVQRTASGASGMRLTIREPDTGDVVTDFATIHEKTFHLFVVSRDLDYFAHVHPAPQKDGSFLLKHSLTPGEYMLIADFLPVGGTAQMLQRAIIVGARPRTKAVRSPMSSPARLEDRARAPKETVVDGVRVALKVADMAPGKDACLTFTLTDATTGASITDLEPFLGAPAHMLMVRGGLEDAVHVHPEEIQTAGPTISFHPLIPAAGLYKLWVQFRRGGRESTASFVVAADGGGVRLP